MDNVSRANTLDINSAGDDIMSFSHKYNEEIDAIYKTLNKLIAAVNDDSVKTEFEKLAEKVTALTIPETSDTGEKGKVPVYADNQTIYGNITGKAQTATNAENASKIANVSVIIDGDLQDGDMLVYSAEKQGFIIKRFEEEPTGEGSDAP